MKVVVILPGIILKEVEKLVISTSRLGLAVTVCEDEQRTILSEFHGRV